MPDRPVIPAAYESRCPVCDLPIYEGDPISPNDDDEWCHEDCADG